MLVATGRLTHAGPGLVSHSKFSPMFKADNHAGNLFRVMFEHGLRGYTHWNDYFSDYGNREPTHATHNPFTYSWGHPDLSVWAILEQDPEKQRVFDAGMGSENSISQRYGGPTEIFNFGWVAEAAATAKGALLVDVGGNRGKTVQAILEAVPGIPRERCIVQDLPEVIDGAIKDGNLDLRGIQMIGHNFNKEQPVKGMTPTIAVAERFNANSLGEQVPLSTSSAASYIITQMTHASASYRTSRLRFRPTTPAPASSSWTKWSPTLQPLETRPRT